VLDRWVVERRTLDPGPVDLVFSLESDRARAGAAPVVAVPTLSASGVSLRNRHADHRAGEHGIAPAAHRASAPARVEGLSLPQSNCTVVGSRVACRWSTPSASAALLTDAEHLGRGTRGVLGLDSLTT
jgi:hypothetical protein